MYTLILNRECLLSLLENQVTEPKHDRGAYVYLSEKNVKILLSKLDRVRLKEYSACAIMKNDTTHELFPSSDEFLVSAAELTDDLGGAKVFCVPDRLYYHLRPAGIMIDKDELRIKSVA